MAEIFYFTGIACLGSALVLSLVASISVPISSALDFVRINLPTIGTEVRLGIWGVCQLHKRGKTDCHHKGSGYSFSFADAEGDFSVIGGAWTRGLAIHPFVTLLIFFALALACLKHPKGPIMASLASLFAAFFAAIAFMIDIAFYAKAHSAAHDIVKETNGSTTAGPAFWMSFISLILILVGGCTVCFGHRKNRAANGDALGSNSGFLGRVF
ncbi:hypothetical protein C8R46DRAFT_1218833 [Mycena filopes]|nr:hypothetical protein C8R46DRAFT_1218833 [Mycena filopes]